MPYFIFLIAFCMSQQLSAQLSLLDMSFKQPPATGSFSITDLSLHRFPVHKSDVPLLMEQLIAIAKNIDQQDMQQQHQYSVPSGASLLLVQKVRKQQQWVWNIIVATALEGKKVYYDLVKDEENDRQVQRRLIDLATYLHAGQ